MVFELYQHWDAGFIGVYRRSSAANGFLSFDRIDRRLSAFIGG